MTISSSIRRALVAAMLVAVATLPACAARRAMPAIATPPDSATCSAIAAAIDSLVLGRDGGRVGLVTETYVADEAHSIAEFREQIAELPGLDSATRRDFGAKNQVSAPSCASLPLLDVMTPLARTAVDSLPRDADEHWRAFHARWPGVVGVTSTSGVGIGAGGRQALLVLTHGCGSLCGHQHLVLLERDDAGRWRVKQAKMLWVS